MLGPTRSTPIVCTRKGTWTTALPTRSPPFDSTSRTSCSPSRLGDERVILPGAAGADPGALPGRARGRAGYGLGGAESRQSDAGRPHRIAMSLLAKLRGPGTGASQVHRDLCLPDTVDTRGPKGK